MSSWWRRSKAARRLGRIKNFPLNRWFLINRRRAPVRSKEALKRRPKRRKKVERATQQITRTIERAENRDFSGRHYFACCALLRSEERRVGKEWRSWWVACALRTKGIW